MRRWVFGLAVLLLVAGCRPAQETPVVPAPATAAPSATPSTADAVEGGGTLRWAIARPTAIVPAEATDPSALLVVDTLYDSLTRVEADGAVRPSAAVRWTSGDRGRRWRFTLRPGARYHDGTPVRAGDFVTAWTRVVELGRTGPHLEDVVGYRAVRAGRAARLAGVRAIDDITLEVRLSRPQMELPAVVAHPTLAPQPVRAVTARRGRERPVGNGPYRMAEPWNSGGFIRVQRYGEWRNGPAESSPARVREVVFRVIDPDAAYVGFQQGRIDVAPVPAGALRQARRTYGAAAGDRGPGVVDAPLPALYFLAFATDRPPWNDVLARRSLSLAIDRDAVVGQQEDLALDAARAIVPPALARRARPPCTSCLHLPSLAEAGFAEAGVETVTLTIDADGGHEPIAEQIRRDLAAVGVSVEVRTLPFGEYLAAVEAGDLALFRFGWEAQYPRAGAMLEATVRSGTPAERGDGANYSGYADRQVDDLLDRARRARSATRREALWVDAERRALDTQAIVPLFSFRQRLVVGERVRDLVVTPWGTATPERARLVADPDIAG